MCLKFKKNVISYDRYATKREIVRFFITLISSSCRHVLIMSDRDKTLPNLIYKCYWNKFPICISHVIFTNKFFPYTNKRHPNIQYCDSESVRGREMLRHGVLCTCPGPIRGDAFVEYYYAV